MHSDAATLSTISRSDIGQSGSNTSAASIFPRLPIIFVCATLTAAASCLPPEREQGLPPSFVSSPEISSSAAFASRGLTERTDLFRAALFEAIVADVEEVGPPDHLTWSYAVTTLFPFVTADDLPLPLLTALEGGGLGAEWHIGDMNVELRFRSPLRVYCLIEDARREVQPFRGNDPQMKVAGEALRVVRMRLKEATTVV